MKDIQVDFTDDKPQDIPWPDEIKQVRAELEGLDDVDLVQLLQEISKIRLEVVKSRKKQPEGPPPLSEEKGTRFLTMAINELRRLQPEVANLKADTVVSVKEEFLRQLFPVIDSFDRFFESVTATGDPKLTKWMDGIRGIYNSVLMILRKNEVKEIPARGIFNPKFHGAVRTEIRNDIAPGTIIKVERRGFIIGKKILRTPEVTVSKRTDIVE